MRVIIPENSEFRRPLCRRTQNGAFTLVELLVVIAIIAILAAMLLPCLGKAKTKARMIEEMSAGRQLILAVQMFAEDNDGALFPGYLADTGAVDNTGAPLSFPENARYPWRIIPYLSGSMETIYSGENRNKLADLRATSQANYVYSVSLFPSLGMNSYFIGGNQSEFAAADANAVFGSGTVVTKVSQVKQPSQLMAFISARSEVSGSSAQGYFQVTPPYLKTRQWAASYSAGVTPNQWGFVSPRLNNHSVAALLDGHVESFNLQEMQDMRHWCNRADRPDWMLAP